MGVFALLLLLTRIIITIIYVLVKSSTRNTPALVFHKLSPLCLTPRLATITRAHFPIFRERACCCYCYGRIYYFHISLVFYTEKLPRRHNAVWNIFVTVLLLLLYFVFVYIIFESFTLSFRSKLIHERRTQMVHAYNIIIVFMKVWEKKKLFSHPDVLWKYV